MYGVRNRGCTQPKKQVALLGQRKKVAGTRQCLAHVVPGRREHGADRQQECAGGSHEQQRRIGQRRLGGSKARQRAQRDHLTQRHDDRHDHDSHHEGEGNRTAWIARFACRHGHDFIAPEGEDQQQAGGREVG